MEILTSIIDNIEQLERRLYLRGGLRPNYLVLSKPVYMRLKEERGIPAYEEIPKYRGYFIHIVPTEEYILTFK